MSNNDTCGKQCSEHSGLIKEILWLKKSMYVGFSVILGVIIYYMAPLQATMAEIQKGNIDLNEKFMNTSSTHEMTLQQQGFRIDTLESFCCIGEDDD